MDLFLKPVRLFGMLRDWELGTSCWGTLGAGNLGDRFWLLGSGVAGCLWNRSYVRDLVHVEK